MGGICSHDNANHETHEFTPEERDELDKEWEVEKKRMIDAGTNTVANASFAGVQTFMSF